MAKRRAEPRWLSRTVVDAIHAEQIREHGGLPGIRDETARECALARAHNRWHCAETTDIASLAAAYTDDEVFAEIVALAGGQVSEQALAEWIRQHGKQQ